MRLKKTVLSFQGIRSRAMFFSLLPARSEESKKVSVSRATTEYFLRDPQGPRVQGDSGAIAPVHELCRGLHSSGVIVGDNHIIEHAVTPPWKRLEAAKRLGAA